MSLGPLVSEEKCRCRQMRHHGDGLSIAEVLFLCRYLYAYLCWWFRAYYFTSSPCSIVSVPIIRSSGAVYGYQPTLSGHAAPIRALFDVLHRYTIPRFISNQNDG